MMPEVHVVHPVGELDLATADSAVSPWFELIDDDLPTTIVVDLAEVTFIDSAGLSALIRLRKRVAPAGGAVLLRNASRQIRQLLSITALDRAFPGAHLPVDQIDSDTWVGPSSWRRDQSATAGPDGRTDGRP